ncbi:hypothetical protein [Cohnella thermotolerans]|uniref:hypothetical protein n=1 Tax=Cohnella thermotolerans TaxID=329858 RepID=UPI00041EA00D|nr:hypothetical protein [Cohnella thermotolerans]
MAQTKAACTEDRHSRTSAGSVVPRFRPRGLACGASAAAGRGVRSRALRGARSECPAGQVGFFMSKAQ